MLVEQADELLFCLHDGDRVHLEFAQCHGLEGLVSVAHEGDSGLLQLQAMVQVLEQVDARSMVEGISFESAHVTDEDHFGTRRLALPVLFR